MLSFLRSKHAFPSAFPIEMHHMFVFSLYRSRTCQSKKENMVVGIYKTRFNVVVVVVVVVGVIE